MLKSVILGAGMSLALSLSAMASEKATLEIRGSELQTYREAIKLAIDEARIMCKVDIYTYSISRYDMDKFELLRMQGEDSQVLAFDQVTRDQKSNEVSIVIRRTFTLNSKRNKIVGVEDRLYRHQLVNKGSITSPRLTEELALVDVRHCKVKNH